MKDLKFKLNNQTFTFEFGTDMCITDCVGNRWNDDEFFGISHTFININTPEGNSIIRLMDRDFSDDDFELTIECIDQISIDTNFEEIYKVFVENRQYFLECYSYILNNPDQNGEC